jgi:FlaG/FlaF family flagellin (archaellin)
MFRRIAAAVAVIAVIAVAIALAAGGSAQADPHSTLYRNFCPQDQSQVEAAGPYSPSMQTDAKSNRP